VDNGAERGETSRSLIDAIVAFRGEDLSPSRVTRLSDLSRAEAKTLAEAWQSIPEPTRETLVRRFDELSEERVDIDFRRALRIALDDPSPVVRQLAIAGLWEDESADLLDRLEHLLSDDPSADVRAEAARGLERFSNKATIGDLSAEQSRHLREALLHAATDVKSPYGVRRRALESLGPYGSESDVSKAISEAYDSGDHGLQCSSIYAMGRSQQARWLPAVLTELETDDPELRYEAARAAGALGAVDALPLLLDAARDEDVEVRHAAIDAIGKIGGRGAVRALERLTEDAGEADLELIESTIEDVNTLLEPFQFS
jgi:HEAT repeat protein